MKEATQDSVTFGSRTIPFTLSFSKRKTLGIDVNPDLSVAVTAPEGKNIEDIKKIVKKRAPWILKKQREFEKSLPSVMPREYAAGETWRYLGRQYRLRIEETAEMEEVKLKGGFLTVKARDRADQERIKALVDKWYRDRAQAYFHEKLKQCHDLVRKYGAPFPEMKLRAMQKRWGSCSTDGSILLNPELVKLPSHCVEYVIMHELCHLVRHDHGPEFFRLLARVMPDWEKRKQRLDSMAHEVLPLSME